MLENRYLALHFADGVLRATNRLSGTVTDFSLPGFGLVLEGTELSGADFAMSGPRLQAGGAVLSGRNEDTGIEVQVNYTLAEDEPWFRKQLLLRAPGALPTPDRLIVHAEERPPQPVRRVGYGLRGGPHAEEQQGLDTYVPQPGCGYPVWAGEWFLGVEHPAAFTVPGARLELYHHPVWEDGAITSFAAVFGVARSHSQVAQAFMDYLWRVRRPRLERPFLIFSNGWSTRALGGGEYIAGFDSNLAFMRAMLDLGLRPDGMGIDAGYFDRRSIFRHKGDGEDDALFREFARQVREAGLELSVWVSHNGATGFDMDWIRAQGWETGEGPEATYAHGEFVVMMQPSFEEALAQRFCQIVGEIGARHLKIDWDNECARNGHFTERYPTAHHVREASLRAFNRIDRRMRAVNPRLITRNGWWPSPWWLQWADHVWLATSGDCEYAAWPARTFRDRENTHRDAVYYQITRVSETPIPLDAIDNHGFAHSVDNPAAELPHTWLDNAVLQFTRGTTYLHMPICPESLDEWEARTLQQVMDWMHYHAHELGTKGARMVGGRPHAGEIYGYLHPYAEGAWLVLRNPDPRPQVYGGGLSLARELGWAPRTWRQVYPYWLDLPLLAGITMLGHEVRLIQLLREPQPELSPVPGAPFMVRQTADGWEYVFPGFAPLAEGIGPTVHPDMQIPDISAEQTADCALVGGWRRQWYCGLPHRLEQAELYVTIRGAQEDLDGLTVRCGFSRYRGGFEGGHLMPVQRIFRNEWRGYGTGMFLPPLGPRERDDYVVAIPDGGYCSLTLDLLGAGAERVRTEVWITGWEAPARQTIVSQTAPMAGPLLPPHPYGFSRCRRI